MAGPLTHANKNINSSNDDDNAAVAVAITTNTATDDKPSLHPCAHRRTCHNRQLSQFSCIQGDQASYTLHLPHFRDFPVNFQRSL